MRNSTSWSGWRSYRRESVLVASQQIVKLMAARAKLPAFGIIHLRRKA